MIAKKRNLMQKIYMEPIFTVKHKARTYLMFSIFFTLTFPLSAEPDKALQMYFESMSFSGRIKFLQEFNDAEPLREWFNWILKENFSPPDEGAFLIQLLIQNQVFFREDFQEISQTLLERNLHHDPVIRQGYLQAAVNAQRADLVFLNHLGADLLEILIDTEGFPPPLIHRDIYLICELYHNLNPENYYLHKIRNLIRDKALVKKLYENLQEW